MRTIERVIVVPHTHWDREWYEPEHWFRPRLLDTVDRVLDLLEDDPGVKCFLLDGQLSVVEDYLALAPDRRAQIETLTRAGRLLLGPWFVLADELMSSDEVLVRNLLVGRETADRLGGWHAVGYSPDAFGHPAVLPTVLNGFGIHRAVVWRGVDPETTENRDLFRWVGPDGSEVVSYHLPPDGYEFGVELPTVREAAKDRWTSIRKELSERCATGSVLLLNGADHHAPQPDIGRAVQLLRDVAPGVDVRLASPTDFFDSLPASDALPAVTGELRFSYRYTWTLQGVHSTRSRLKRLIAEGERLLVRWAEPQAALAAFSAGRDRKRWLRSLWRAHLLSCAHDSFGGCSTDAVARDVGSRADRVASAARDLFVDAVRDRVGFDATQARRNRDGWRPSMLVVNPSPALRSEVVEATLAYHVADIPVGRPRDLESVQERLCSATTTPPVASVVVKDSDGHAIPAQVLDRYSAYDRLDSPRDYPDQDQVEAVRVALQVADVPPLGVKRFAVETGSAAPAARDGVRADGAALLSSWCEVRAAADAAVTVHPRAEPFVLDAVGQLESERDEGDTYTFQPVDGDRRAVAEWGVPRVVWRGPLIACLARDFVVADRARGVMYVRLRAGSGMIDYVVDGVNLCGNHRLRISFPTPRGSDDRRSVADMQFGPVMRRRESHDRRAYPFEWPVVTAPMHRYVSAGGLTVCARGIFEYEHHDDGRLLLTLLRATGELSRGNLQARPGHAGWPRPTPDAQEPGGFRAELAIRIDGADQSSTAAAWSELERAVESFDAPLAGIMLRPAIDLPDRIAGPTLDGEGLVFKSLKPAESGDAVVMRCVNVSERRVRGAVRWPGGFGAVSRARLDETPVDDRRLRVAGDQLSFVAEPREVVTLLFRP